MINSSLLRALLCAVGSGIATALLAEASYGGWWQILALSIFWYLLAYFRLQQKRTFFILGMGFGLAYFVCSLWWIYISLHDVGGLSWLLAGFGVFALSSYLSLFFGMALLLAHCISQAAKKTSLAILLNALLFASSWTLLEYLRGSLLTGFPWSGFAETQVNGPFAVIAPWFGGLACTFAVFWLSYLIAQLRLAPWKVSGMVVSGVLLCQVFGIGHFTQAYEKPISVRLLQGNFAQSQQFNPPAIMRQIQLYLTLIEEKSANLIVIPETAFPWPESQLPAGAITQLQAFAQASASQVLIGVVGQIDGENNKVLFTNRALGLSQDRPSYVYDKSHLVPFGEFIPPGFQWFVDEFKIPLSNFGRGAVNQPPFLIQPTNSKPLGAAITICYEDVFGGELAARLRNATAPINLLVNMTNLVWFGHSQAPTQQLRLSQLRSLETGLPSIRATNTGITAIIGADGRVLAQLPQFTRAELQMEVQAYSGKTPYVLWGDLPILAFCGVLILFGLSCKLKRRLS
ncbi:apolipoprotein N-acyltransferase [Polynucleobacter sp. IMCC30063]|uniref:apolipoprotein N-acyltransferase n=1 Tax=Polynucleobacter sp. IMCC30063 TaxID=2907298 RepID=UPI001F45AE1B|nr:apolipoprotein N-acyltransferase [Polynucleobacter sp. IMCC30063]MCE7504641.1 apolipoprotein N-acyltransferase [Polynucleobacter sp. IMCC30063]